MIIRRTFKEISNNGIIKATIGEITLKIYPKIKYKQIIVDVNVKSNQLILVGTYKNMKQPFVKSIQLDNLSFTEIADLIITIANAARPKKIIIDPYGVGRGILDSLELMLQENNLELNHKNGKLKYLT